MWINYYIDPIRSLKSLLYKIDKLSNTFEQDGPVAFCRISLQERLSSTLYKNEFSIKNSSSSVILLVWLFTAKYVLVEKQGIVHATLHKDSTSADVLQSFFHALVMANLTDKNKSVHLESQSWMDKHYEVFIQKVHFNFLSSTSISCIFAYLMTQLDCACCPFGRMAYTLSYRVPTGLLKIIFFSMMGETNLHWWVGYPVPLILACVGPLSWYWSIEIEGCSGFSKCSRVYVLCIIYWRSPAPLHILVWLQKKNRFL